MQFGVMKQRDRCLRVPMLFHDAQMCEETALMCAIKHNLLLEADGYDSIGELEGDWLRKDIEDSDARVHKRLRVTCGDRND